jgi:heme exporter protein D
MYFENLSAALTMGGHGGYVWSAYALTVVVLALILILPRRRRIRVLKRLAAEQKRQGQGPNTVEEGV